MGTKRVNILITGAGGFVGQTLARYLRAALPHARLIGTQQPGHAAPALDGVQWVYADLRDPDAAQAVLSAAQPSQIYHLAGQAFVPRSFENPWETLETNIRAQLNLLTGCIALGIAPRMVIAGSAEVYGAANLTPITEDTPLAPSSPYSVSKVAQDMLGLQYHLSHGLPIVRARPFNHFGPGQSDLFVAPAFAMQIARIEAGLQPPILKVGDLSARRDFTDVRDVVRAYHLMMEHGRAGEAYNVASGKARTIQSLLEGLLAHARADISVEVDSARLRPSKIPILEGDYSRLHAATGWQPQIPFEQTLRDLLEDCRQRVKGV
jgi:GDP-4-dehydro-6-deoxy-D-mannose reductase